MAFMAGAIATALMLLLVFGRIVTVYYDRMREVEAENFTQAETIVNLEALRSPVYQVPVGSVNPVAQRNVTAPDMPMLEAGDWGLDGGVTHDLTDVDDV